MSDKTKELFQSELKVIVVGLDHFAEALRQQNVAVERVEWRPLAGGNPRLAGLLKKMGVK
jgi:hypothetical protein